VKKKISKILRGSLALVMVLALALALAPVPVAADVVDWSAVDMPDVVEDTDIVCMEVAPDGTIYASVRDELGAPDFTIMKSTDGGYTWADTELSIDSGDTLIAIAVSPNYEEDERVYVASMGEVSNDPVVYRLEDAGDATPKALKPIVDSGANIAQLVYSIDVWSDGISNYVMAGTENDVFMIEDAIRGTWVDYELDKGAAGGAGGAVIAVAFAPDFDDSEVIWAVTDAVSAASTSIVTSTIAPGRWGQWIDAADTTVAGIAPDVIGASLCFPTACIAFPDDYSSYTAGGAVPIFFVGVTDGADGGDVYLIEGVAGDADPTSQDSRATALGCAEDISSIAVSGDYNDAAVLAGNAGLVTTVSTVFRSDDGGTTWDAGVDKQPTGDEGTQVAMAPGPFDIDEGVAYVGTSDALAAGVGFESAVSVSIDGGNTYNQVALIDTTIDVAGDTIDDLALSPEFADDSTALMITSSFTTAMTSLWRSENANEEEDVVWERVRCEVTPVNAMRVDFAWDSSAIYLSGEDALGAPTIWRSTNLAQTFGSARAVTGAAVIADWVVMDSRAIYAATDLGFVRTLNGGLSWSLVDNAGAMVGLQSIALSPAFDDDGYILVGDAAGEAFISANSGSSFTATDLDAVIPGFTGNVFVAFDADFAEEDADGELLIYAAEGVAAVAEENVQVGEVDDTDVDWDDLEDDVADATYAPDCTGLIVAPDNTLYAVDSAAGAETVARLLLHEDDSAWEAAATTVLDLAGANRIWLTTGSNFLWSVATPAAAGDELYVFEDTLTGSPVQAAPDDGSAEMRYDRVTLTWEEVDGNDSYEDTCSEADVVGAPDIGVGGITTEAHRLVATTVAAAGLDAGVTYEWQVRVDAPLLSRWSAVSTFTTALAQPLWSPPLRSPAPTSVADVPLPPVLSWGSADWATSYLLVVAENAELTSPVVDTSVPSTAYKFDAAAYDTTYFWKVRAKSAVASSAWSDVFIFTSEAEPVEEVPQEITVTIPPAEITVEVPAPQVTIEAPPAQPPAEVTVEAPVFTPEITVPAPQVTVTVPPAEAPPTPAYIWVITAIGAVLVIAVIVLIVRTRRAA